VYLYLQTQLHLPLVFQEDCNNDMFRPYMWAIFRLRLDYRISYTGMGGAFLGGGGGFEISLYQWVPTLGKKRAIQITNGSSPDRTRDHGTHCYNEISIRPPHPELPKNAPRNPV